MKKWLKTSSLLLVCLLYITGAYFLNLLMDIHAYAKKKEPKLVYVLFDLSGSAKDQRDQYFQWFKKILVSIGPGDRIVVEAIQTRSAVKARYPVNEVIPEYSPWKDNPLVYKKKKIELIKQIEQTVNSFIKSTPGSKTTEIMSALLPAQQLFNAFPDYKRKILVIMSDMVEESPLYNFIKDPPGPKGAKWIIEREKKGGRLPDLTGVKIYVAGAGGTSSRTMVRLKRFWTAYFTECGAVISDATYGSGLPRFDE